MKYPEKHPFVNMLKHLVVEVDQEQGIDLVLSTTHYIYLDVQVVVVVFLYKTNPWDWHPIFY